MSSSTSAGNAATAAPEEKRARTDAHVAGRVHRIDGSMGEGGGQILRNSISYATILQRELYIDHIRAGRSKPGLKAQHVASLRLPTEIADASGGDRHGLTGDEINSTSVRYAPPRPPPPSETERAAAAAVGGGGGVRTATGKIDTAGSVCLLLQAAIPCALFVGGGAACCKLLLHGGTNAAMAPQYDYWERVFLPTLVRQCGLRPDQIEADVIKRGYFPRGGGEVHVNVRPLSSAATATTTTTEGQEADATTPAAVSGLNPVQLTDRGDVCEVYIRSFHAGKLPRRAAAKMAESAESYLRENIMMKWCRGRTAPEFVTDVVTERDAVGNGLGILVVARTTTGCLLAGSGLCGPKQKAEAVGVAAARELCSTLNDGGCVDEWLQDQLILYMALAKGTSKMIAGSLTLHTQTAIWIATEFTGAQFKVTKLDDVDGGAEVDVIGHIKRRAGATDGGGHENGDDNNNNNNKKKSKKNNDNRYGGDGRMPGRHLIVCHGIGLEPR